MEFDVQLVFNVGVAIILAVISFLGGWLMRVLWSIVKDLQASDKDIQSDHKVIVDKIRAIEVLVAGDYVKSEVYREDIRELFRRLDDMNKVTTSSFRRLEDKLDHKVDK